MTGSVRNVGMNIAGSIQQRSVSVTSKPVVPPAKNYTPPKGAAIKVEQKVYDENRNGILSRIASLVPGKKTTDPQINSKNQGTKNIQQELNEEKKYKDIKTNRIQVAKVSSGGQITHEYAKISDIENALPEIKDKAFKVVVSDNKQSEVILRGETAQQNKERVTKARAVVQNTAFKDQKNQLQAEHIAAQKYLSHVREQTKGKTLTEQEKNAIKNAEGQRDLALGRLQNFYKTTVGKEADYQATAELNQRPRGRQSVPPADLVKPAEEAEVEKPAEESETIKKETTKELPSETDDKAWTVGGWFRGTKDGEVLKEGFTPGGIARSLLTGVAGISIARKIWSWLFPEDEITRAQLAALKARGGAV